MTGLSATEARLAEALRELYAALPQEQVDELHTLAELSEGADLGMRLRYVDDADAFEVVWVGVVLGRVDRAWLNGEGDGDGAATDRG